MNMLLSFFLILSLVGTAISKPLSPLLEQSLKSSLHRNFFFFFYARSSHFKASPFFLNYLIQTVTNVTDRHCLLPNFVSWDATRIS